MIRNHDRHLQELPLVIRGVIGGWEWKSGINVWESPFLLTFGLCIDSFFGFSNANTAYCPQNDFNRTSVRQSVLRQGAVAHQAPVVREVDSAIHWINYYPKDSAIGFRNTYPLDSDLSGG